MEPLVSRYCFLSLFWFCSVCFVGVRAGDAEVLLTLKSAIDPLDSLPWRGRNACRWQGVKECMNGRVTKLVLEYQNLTGPLDEKIVNQLDQLRVLSFKGNSISGRIPDLSGLVNLKSLFLNGNNFSGDFPASITDLHRLKVVVLAGNRISGGIPDSLLKLRRLYVLYLQDNLFSGKIPHLNQSSLRFFNVSNNHLSGNIPVTPALARFNGSSYSGNIALCGEQIQIPCNSSEHPTKRTRLIKIVAGTIGGFVLLGICLILLWVVCKNCFTVNSGERRAAERGNNEGKQRGFSWEGEGLGILVFCGAGDQKMSYSLEDLLKASAETLGRGTVGSTYKAVMESGYIVTVKRLKDARFPGLEEFRRQMDGIGRLRHPNLVPLRAYFQAKEERLLVYDYFPNGSLFSLIHGSRSSGGGKPLHWTSCLKIAQDLAAGLLHIHQNPGLAHGNLKSSNVLLGPDFESCLTDYGLTSLRDPGSAEEPGFYRAPECRDMRKASTQEADVYSFGVLVLELLTGKTPFQDLVLEHGSDIPRWVRSVREEEAESGDEALQGKLRALLKIAMGCVSLVPEKRPAMRDVLKMIRDTRAEASNSYSSDHSPGRWSDTVQSLPREDHLSI